ncbi:hypothetical protein HC256_005324 [Beauveria bassiana]|nr:hypothetical protein HC256_005324 [Beauveria bassiana]
MGQSGFPRVSVDNDRADCDIAAAGEGPCLVELRGEAGVERAGDDQHIHFTPDLSDRDESGLFVSDKSWDLDSDYGRGLSRHRNGCGYRSMGKIPAKLTRFYALLPQRCQAKP